LRRRAIFGEDLKVADDVEELKRALAREREKLSALKDIGAALGSTLDLNELLVLVLGRVSPLMDADRSTLYLLDEDTGELWSKVAQGEDEREIRLKVGEGLAGWVAKSGQTLNIRDVYQDPRFDSEWDRRTGYRTRSVLAVPMKNQHGRTIGVVQVLNKHDGEFIEEDVELLTALASQAAVSIENSKLFLSVVGKNMELLETKELLERKVRDQDVLFEIAQVSASALELDDLLEGVLGRTMRAIDAEAASILIGDEDTGDLRFRAAVGGEPKAVQHLRIKAGQGISGWVAKNKKPQIVNEVEDDPRHSKTIADRVGYHPRSVLCVPLEWEGGGGALELLNKSGGREPFGDDDVRLATMVAGHVSTAIQLATVRERREREDRLSTIGQFMSSVLHDLKTPMTVISGYVQLLTEEKDSDMRSRYAELVQRQVELINTMTRETLAFARGERKLWVRKVYLHKFFIEMAEQLKRELDQMGIDVELVLNDRGVFKFDAPKIQRAIHNLARNAAEAIGKGGGRVQIMVDRRDDGALILTVSDDGPGIPDEIRAKLFAPFATHGKEGGTGLGLAVVRTIVEDHGGSVSVESEPGQTTFTLVLPESNAGPREATPSTPQERGELPAGE